MSIHYTAGLESLLEEYARAEEWAKIPWVPKEPDYNSKEHRLAMAEEILFGEGKMEVYNGSSDLRDWHPSTRRYAFECLYDGGFVRIRP